MHGWVLICHSVLDAEGMSCLDCCFVVRRITSWARLAKHLNCLPNIPNTHTGSEEAGWEITLEFVQEMMVAFRQQKTIHKRFALHIVLQVCINMPCSAYTTITTSPNVGYMLL